MSYFIENTLPALNIPIPSQKLVLTLFNQCMLVRVESQSFMQNTEELRRLGLNAEIVAAQAKTHGQSYGILASEVSNLAEQIRTVLNEMSEETGKLSALSIECIKDTRLLNSYLISLQGIKQAYNSEIIHNKMMTLLSEVHDAFSKIYLEISQLKTTLGEFKRLTIHIPVVTNLMKIIASQNESSEAQFNQMAQKMGQFNVFLLEKIDLLYDTMISASNTIETLNNHSM